MKHFSCARFGFYALFRIHELIFSGILEGYGIQMKVVLILGSWDLGILLCNPLFSSSNCEVWEGERFRTQENLREIRFQPRASETRLGKALREKAKGIL